MKDIREASEIFASVLGLHPVLTCGTSHLRFFFLHQIFALEICTSVGPVLGKQAAPVPDGVH